MDISQVSSLSKQVIAEVERAVVGKRALLEMMMASMLAGGHILLEDFPGGADAYSQRHRSYADNS